MIQNKGIYKRLSPPTICEWLFIILRCVSDAIIEAFDLEKSTFAEFFNGSFCLFQFDWDDIITRYEIDWIGREGLACETHDEFLRVSAKSRIIIIRTIRGQSFCAHIFVMIWFNCSQDTLWIHDMKMSHDSRMLNPNVTNINISWSHEKFAGLYQPFLQECSQACRWV